MSKHVEPSEGLSPKEEVSLSSHLEEEVAIKTVKLGPMRLKSSGASELAEPLTRLPPMGEVGDASDFKEKEVMHEGGPSKVLEQRGRETMGKAKPSVVNQEDSVRGKLEYGQGSDITPCHRDVRMSRTARVKKRQKPRQKSRRKGKAKASRRDRGKSSGGECHGSEFEARDHRTKCIRWRSIIEMGIIWPPKAGPIQGTIGEACQIEA
ncbi:hypothetical protein J1N35_000594 [Gossypium stocksii]|uniref:Uncharacterized protein n=1 Tax=Gossypium stocksii TaxID=47602 RepID=A0A9D3WIN1_9ROSI|nr:hypothetical protein J1N35_000594 [Gossypium stocksii]